MEECIFCKIIQGQITSDIIYSDHQFIAIKDIRPKAPIHLLIIPKAHIPNLDEIAPENEQFTENILSVARQLAIANNLDKSGYRLVLNVKADGGQEVNHLHLHLLGGQKLGAMG